MDNIIWDQTPNQLRERILKQPSGIIRDSMQHQIDFPEKYWRCVAACYPSRGYQPMHSNLGEPPRDE